MQTLCFYALSFEITLLLSKILIAIYFILYIYILINLDLIVNKNIHNIVVFLCDVLLHYRSYFPRKKFIIVNFLPKANIQK